MISVTSLPTLHLKGQLISSTTNCSSNEIMVNFYFSKCCLVL